MFGAGSGGDFYGETPRAGWMLEMLPELHHILLGIQRAVIEGASVIGSEPNRRSDFGAQREEFIDIGFPVTYGHELGPPTHGPRVLQRVAPAIALFFFNGRDIARLGAVLGHRLTGAD